MTTIPRTIEEFEQENSAISADQIENLCRLFTRTALREYGYGMLYTEMPAKKQEAVCSAMRAVVARVECKYQDEIAELKAEIARLKSPWQPISTLPASGVYQAARYDEENTDTPECLEMVRAPMLKDGRILNLNSGNYARPGTFTHWCELPAPFDQRPAPPAEGEKEGGK